LPADRQLAIIRSAGKAASLVAPLSSTLD